MTDFGEQIREADVDRVREFTSIGAGHAATALAQIVGSPCAMRVPTARVLPAEHASAPLVASAADREMVGVFFEVEGGLGGVLALLFPMETCHRLVERLLGAPRSRRPVAVNPELAESAIREVGNILASHVASSHAELLGTTVVPSIPVLAMEDAPQALASLLALRESAGPALRVETEISDRRRDIQGVLVFVPDRASAAPAPEPSSPGPVAGAATFG